MTNIAFINEILENITPNETHQGYILAMTIFFTSFLLIKLVKQLILQRARAIAKKTDNDVDDLMIGILNKLNVFFNIALSIFLAVRLIDFDEGFENIVESLALVVFTYYAIQSLIAITNYSTKKTLKRQQDTNEQYDPTILKITSNFLKIVLWILGAIFLLQNFGYNVTAILGGIGVLGIAIAFGLQTVLEDVFAFFSIYFDRPFKVGDFVVIGNGDMGTVKKVGIRSTRIKTLQGEELVVSNRDLTAARINNYKKMHERRIEFTLGVTYDTGSKNLKSIPEIIEKVVNEEKQAEFKRAHFKEFGEYALVFEIVYNVMDSDYNVYMDTQQSINLAIVKEFEKAGIEMAFPTQTIQMVK